MLQTSVTITNKEATLHLINQILEGGCGWIDLDLGNEEETVYKPIVEDIMEICRQHEAILTIQHDVELVDRLKVSGVHLFPGDISAVFAREQLGPHAIIGVEVGKIADLFTFAKIDIDFASINVSYYQNNPQQCITELKTLREAGIKLPIVAFGDISVDNASEIINAGFNGIELYVSSNITSEYIESLQDALNHLK